MKAKDTLPPGGVHSKDIWCPDCGYEFSIKDRIKAEREAQAKYLFSLGEKAGIKLVVDWVENHGGSLDSCRLEWQTICKRKE